MRPGTRSEHVIIKPHKASYATASPSLCSTSFKAQGIMHPSMVFAFLVVILVLEATASDTSRRAQPRGAPVLRDVFAAVGGQSPPIVTLGLSSPSSA